MPKLKDIREERLMSQEGLAHQAEVSSKTISRIERGVGKTSLKSRQKIANALLTCPPKRSPVIMLVKQDKKGG